MPNTTTGSLADSQQLITDSARTTREYEGTFRRTCDFQQLEKGTGLNWEEILLAQLTAQTITETTVLADPQQYTDSMFTITPVVSAINTIVTDRVYRRLSTKTIAKMGPLCQQAMQRKKDEDYLATFAGATTTLSGTGTTLASGVIRAASRRITSNVTEGANSPVFTVLHGYQIKDLEDELGSGVGTYTDITGLTEEVWRKGLRGTISSTTLFEDGNIAINATPDARGAVHAREAIVFVQGHEPRTETKRRPEIGGGADELFMFDEFALGERSAGNWLYGILSDATVPSS